MLYSQPSRGQAALLLMAGRVVASLMTIVTVGLLSRWWSAWDYGEYRRVWLTFQVLCPFVMLGAPAGLAFFLPQFDRGRQKAALGQTALLLVCSGSLISVAMLAGNLIMGSSGTHGDPSATLAFAAYPVFALPLLAMDSWLLAIHKSRAAAMFTMQTAFLQASAAILPAAFGCGVATVMACLTLATVVRFLIALFIYRSEYADVTALWDRGFPSRMLAYAVPVGLAGIVGSVHFMLDKFVVACWVDVESFAIYANGATELPILAVVSGAVAAVLGPEFVRFFQAGRLGEMVSLWHSSVRMTALAVMPLAAGMLVFAPDAVAFLYSDKYLDCVPIFRIYLLLLPLRITVYGSLLLAAGRSRVILSTSAVGLILAAVLVGTLMPLFGMPGAAVAVVLSAYLVAAFLLLCTARVLGVPWRRVFPWRDLGTTLAASGAGALAASVVTQPLEPGLVRLAAGLGITGLVGMAILMGLPGTRGDVVAIVAAVLGRGSHWRASSHSRRGA